MITPTKGIDADRALLTVASELFALLVQPLTVSKLWSEYRKQRTRSNGSATLGFDWFVLALDLAFVMGVVEFTEDDLLEQVSS